MDDEAHARAAYEEARDEYLTQTGREPGADGVYHEILLLWDEDFEAAIEFEELSADGTVCGAHRVPTGTFAFGSALDVIAATADSAPTGWVSAVCAALARELSWETEWGTGRRSMLLVVRGTGTMFHVSPSANRESILAHGLDWRLMGEERGIAGSVAPELPANFLCASPEDAEFFLGMARMPADLWAVDVAGMWLEGDPGSSGGGGANWLLLPEPLPPGRLRLLEGQEASISARRPKGT